MEDNFNNKNEEHTLKIKKRWQLQQAFFFAYEMICIKFVGLGEKIQAMMMGKSKGNTKQFPENEDEEILYILPKAKGIPIFGTFFELMRVGGAKNLHYYIDGRHGTLGEIFQEQLGGFSEICVFVSSASIMRSVFLNEGQYPRHPLPAAWLLYNKEFNCKRGLFFMDGEEWFHNRRILNRFLLNGGISWMDDRIKVTTGQMINEWKQQTNSLRGRKNRFTIPELERRLFRWAVDVICSIMFGPMVSDCPKLEEKLQYFSDIVQNVFEKTTALMNFPPKLAKLLRLRIWREFEQNVEKVLRIGNEIIDMFVALNDGTNCSESALPETTETISLFHLLEDAQMSLDMIKRIFVDLVIAAGDTTAYTSVWALYSLATRVSMQRELAKDVLEHGDMSPLVRGLIKETLRLYPVAPFIGRYIVNDAIFDNFFVPKDSLVLLSLFTAGRDFRHFPDAHLMKPERWLVNPTTGEFEGVYEAHASLPFAIGQRSCIGRKVAFKQLHSLLSQVISNFQLNCTNHEIIEPILRMVTVPNHPIKLELRNR